MAGYRRKSGLQKAASEKRKGKRWLPLRLLKNPLFFKERVLF
jgi:hypothetical protein